jgi:hypothetical protein
MADYFFNNPHPCDPTKRELVYGFLEANSQSFKAGQLVAYNSGVIAAASDTQALLGIAMKDATNVTSDNIEIPFYPIYPEDEWEIKLTSGGTATAASSFTQGTRYGTYVASNVAYLDYAETSTDNCIFKEPIDAVNRPYWGKVTFISTVCYMFVGTGA